MDRTELIAHIEEQIAHIGANVPAGQGGSAAVHSLEAIVAALGSPAPRARSGPPRGWCATSRSWAGSPGA